MKKYFRVFLELLNISSKQYLENRGNALGYATSHVLSLLLMVFFIEVYFSYGSSIQGWTKYQVLFLAGIFRLMSAIFSIVFVKNVTLLPVYIQKGGLDIFLTKPINSQFYLSFRLMRTYDFLTIISAFTLVAYSLMQMQQLFSLTSWILLIIGLLAGISILYGIFFSIATLSIWLVRFEVLPDLYKTFEITLGIPTDFYGSKLAPVLTFIIPLGLILTTPVKVFFGTGSAFLILYGILFAIICLGFSMWFWNFALKHYTSASS